MTTLGNVPSAKTLVDMSKGTISREIFVNKEIYAQEQERIFARAWLLVGHESQIPKPGDYFVGRMGEESVIMARDRQGKTHVFLNSCRHRGMKVCRYDEGNTPVFTCPYHGWSFGLDGKLVGVPYFKEAYHSELKKEEWGLVEVAKMAVYRGWVWATWDGDAPDFDDYLGDMKFYFDNMIDGGTGDPDNQTLWVGVQKWRFPGNWKFAAENFIGDFYHNVSHRSVNIVGISPSGRQGRHLQDTIQIPRTWVNWSDPSRGHGAVVSYTEQEVPYIESYAMAPPEVEEYYRQAHANRRRRMGDATRSAPSVGTVFPNASLSAGRSIAVWHPAGPHQTEAWRFYFVTKDAPQAVVDTMRHYALRYAGPGGMTEQDDMENWNYATAASNGTIAKRRPYNYALGLGHEYDKPKAPWLGKSGRWSDGISEQNQRAMYQRWADFMDTASWDELKPR
ncbi:MAG: Rieske 2Fe-2S domain-containing protein [SAR202 cluster bacterium]|nr:Rieske 2Fe-2S domain-containing protein [SAR202 cluster bacterium]